MLASRLLVITVQRGGVYLSSFSHVLNLLFLLSFSDDTQADNKRISIKAMKEKLDRGEVSEGQLNSYMSHVQACSCNRIVNVGFSEATHVKFDRPSTVLEPGLVMYAGS